jgi:hypothetical protein
MTQQPKRTPPLTPEEIFAEAVQERGGNLTEKDMCCLRKGLQFLQENQKNTLNDIELQSISGLISYVCYYQKVDEATVIEILTARYNIADVKALPSRLYQNAVEFLVDLEIKKIMN